MVRWWIDSTAKDIRICVRHRHVDVWSVNSTAIRKNVRQRTLSTKLAITLNIKSIIHRFTRRGGAIDVLW